MLKIINTRHSRLSQRLCRASRAAAEPSGDEQDGGGAATSSESRIQRDLIVLGCYTTLTSSFFQHLSFFFDPLRAVFAWCHSTPTLLLAAPYSDSQDRAPGEEHQDKDGDSGSTDS